MLETRQVIMYLLREDFNVSYPLIGSKIGGKDHSTVIHSHLKKRRFKNRPIIITRNRKNKNFV